MARYSSGTYCMDDNLFINWQVKERDRNGKMSVSPQSAVPSTPTLGSRHRLARERAGDKDGELLGLSQE